MSSKPKLRGKQAENIMDADQFKRWLSSALVGERITYHRGYLVSDREAWISNRAPAEVIGRIDAVGKLAMIAAMAGHVELSQRKQGIEDYEYLARKREAGKNAVPLNALVK